MNLIPTVNRNLDCTDCSEPVITKFEVGTNQLLGATTQKQEDGSWWLVINNQVDYELLTNPQFAFTISNEHSVIVQINNIDDNPPSVIPITISCEIEVNILFIFNVDLLIIFSLGKLQWRGILLL